MDNQSEVNNELRKEIIEMKNEFMKLKKKVHDEMEQKEMSWGVKDNINNRLGTIHSSGKFLHKENKVLRNLIEKVEKEKTQIAQSTPQVQNK